MARVRVPQHLAVAGGDLLARGRHLGGRVAHARPRLPAVLALLVRRHVAQVSVSSSPSDDVGAGDAVHVRVRLRRTGLRRAQPERSPARVRDAHHARSLSVAARFPVALFILIVIVIISPSRGVVHVHGLHVRRERGVERRVLRDRSHVHARLLAAFLRERRRRQSGG